MLLRLNIISLALLVALASVAFGQGEKKSTTSQDVKEASNNNPPKTAPVKKKQSSITRLKFGSAGEISLTGSDKGGGSFTLTDNKGRTTHTGSWQESEGGIIDWTSNSGLPEIAGRTNWYEGAWRVQWRTQAKTAAGSISLYPGKDPILTSISTGPNAVSEQNAKSAKDKGKTPGALSSGARPIRSQKGAAKKPVAKIVPQKRGVPHPIFGQRRVAQSKRLTPSKKKSKVGTRIPIKPIVSKKQVAKK